MIKRVVARSGSRTVIAMDSISHVDANDVGHIVVSGSHGGIGVPAGAVSHVTARIGDAEDAWEHGVISI